MNLVRGTCAFLLLVLGPLVFFFSAIVGFGVHQPLSFPAILIAFVAVVLTLFGYRMIRESDAEPIAAISVFLVLGVGSALLIFGLLAIPIVLSSAASRDLPVPYFLVVGSLSVLGLWKFRKYRAIGETHSK